MAVKEIDPILQLAVVPFHEKGYPNAFILTHGRYGHMMIKASEIMTMGYCPKNMISDYDEDDEDIVVFMTLRDGGNVPIVYTDDSEQARVMLAYMSSLVVKILEGKYKESGDDVEDRGRGGGKHEIT